MNILKRAKEQCEYLIVGVSTDGLVQSYKNKTPVINFEQRAAIVEGCRYVDQVVAQESMDKLSAWDDLRFDATFHGDEWKGTDLYNKYIEDFGKIGVDVVFIPHTKNISSTLLRTKINENK